MKACIDRGDGMCPQCGALFKIDTDLVPVHKNSEQTCEGSEQNWRNPLSDGRPLWNGKRNPHFYKEVTQ